MTADGGNRQVRWVLVAILSAVAALMIIQRERFSASGTRDSASAPPTTTSSGLLAVDAAAGSSNVDSARGNRAASSGPAVCKAHPTLCNAVPAKMNAFLDLWDSPNENVDGQAALKAALKRPPPPSSCSASGITTSVVVLGKGFSTKRSLNLEDTATTFRTDQETQAKLRAAFDTSSTSAHDALEQSATAVGADAAAVGQWARFWLVAVDGDGRRVCRGGEGLEVRLESAAAKVAVDRVMDIGHGVHEVHVFVRKRGVYRLDVDPVVVVPPQETVADQPVQFRLARDNDVIDAAFNATMGKVIAGDLKNKEDKSGSHPWCPAKTFSRDATIAFGAFTQGSDVVPARVPCPRCSHPDRFRAGGWVRIGDGSVACDGIHCDGNLAGMQSEGWVWASDHCVVRVYGSVADARAALSGHWIVGWGPSTMKQPMANMVEYFLGGKVVPPVTMETIHHWTGSKKRRPNFFTYRLFDTVVAGDAGNATRDIRMSMIWAGCPAVAAPPHACTTTTGMGNRERLSAYIDPKSAALKRVRESSAAAAAPSKEAATYPTAIIMDHFIWRYPLWDESVFVKNIANTIDDYVRPHLSAAAKEGLTASDALHGRSRRRTMPLLVWNTANHPIHSDTNRACISPPYVNRQRHFMWVIEDFVNDRYRGEGSAENTVLLVSRFHITMPFHFTDEWAHFGIHYGATKGMCLTGIDYKASYEVSRCLRKTYPETMVYTLWTNAVEEWYRSD